MNTTYTNATDTNHVWLAFCDIIVSYCGSAGRKSPLQNNLNQKELHMQTSTHMSTPSHLPNGHELVNLYYNARTKCGVVLGRSYGAVQPYATWVFFNDDLRSTSYGHYFKMHAEASHDFMKRVAEEA